MGLFLTPEEMAELTGIGRAKDHISRQDRQVAALRKMKIPHYVNAAGYPIVARAVIEGIGAAPKPVETWEPRLAHA